METPFKIVVAADLTPGAGGDAPLRYQSGGVDQLLAALRPSFRLGDPLVELQLTSLEEFAPPALLQGRKELENPRQMTALIQHPGFQALESAWRGLDFLLRRLPEQGVVVEVLPTSRDELRDRLYQQVFLPQYRGEASVPAGVILLDFDFDHHPASLAVLDDLARMAEAMQTPMVAQTTAAFFGLRHLLHLPALRDLAGKMEGPEYISWHAFRKKPEASWLCLCLNRFLLREPHEFAGYQEPASASHPESYLWGRAIWLLGANLARCWGGEGHPLYISGPGGGGEQAGLPLRELPISRSQSVKTPLEAVLPLELVELLPRLGLSPLTQLPPDLGGEQRPDAVYLHLGANLRRFSDASGQMPGLLPVYATLAYSLALGRAVNLGLGLVGELAGLSGEEAAQRLARRLGEVLGPLGQGEITVEPAEGALAVKIAPEVTIHSRSFTLEFDLPLP